MTSLHVDSTFARVRDFQSRDIATTNRPPGSTVYEWNAMAMAWGATIQAAVAAGAKR